MTYFEGGRIGKALHSGVPVYQLLGGKQRDYVPCFATTQVQSAEELIADANLLIENGWNVIRTGMAQRNQDVFEPRESIGLTATWLTQLREAIGPEPVLGIDYHHRLNVAEAASFCHRMPPGTLDFLEEPIRDETPEAYESLRTMVDVPFAIGEEISSKWDFLPYIERGITNFARLDVCNIGGLTEAMKVASLAEVHYIDLMPHNPLGTVCTAATIHLAAAVPNFAWMEIRESPTERTGRYDTNLFPVQPQAEGSRFPVPELPGLGVEFNEEFALANPAEIEHRHFLRRRDGSITNR